MAEAKPSEQPLEHTPLTALHQELGAKLVPFAGYAMPVQYPMGVLKEHKHTRAHAGLFVVSHMGQAMLTGPDHAAVAGALEKLVPGEILKLGKGRMRYTVLLAPDGGIMDDLMVTRLSDRDGALFLVVNAACKKADFDYIAKHLPANTKLTPWEDRALLALQGPTASDVLGRYAPQATHLGFMMGETVPINGFDAFVTRSGYTGEDGFEISVAAGDADKLARRLLSETEVEPIGLGARDSLRLEAGLCLYGQDIDTSRTPIDANLSWVIGKRRREEGGFAGADRILGQLASGVESVRVGLVGEDRAPARAGTAIADDAGNEIGIITSGTFGPTLERPIAMGYVKPDFTEEGTKVGLMVRGAARPARVAAMPFVPHRYFRKPSKDAPKA